ncbi:MAG: SocA family protein [Gammaproteobacteria bacterium]|nr:SocA family protein [Gammaproteobacteria bacterium]
MLHFHFDEEKALAAILYIADRLLALHDIRIKADLHKIFKVLYFADQKHIVRYGRPITGDHYIAMKDGPVPSHMYDMIKIVRGDSVVQDDKKGYRQFIEVKTHYVSPKQLPDIEHFSDSEIECLDESLTENASLTFQQLREKSHDLAYDRARKDDTISFIDIAKAAGAQPGIIEYMKTVAENEALFHA